MEERQSSQVGAGLKAKRRSEAMMGEEDIGTERRGFTLSEKTLHPQGQEYTR